MTLNSKKIIGLTLAVMALVVLTGCAGKKGDQIGEPTDLSDGVKVKGVEVAGAGALNFKPVVRDSNYFVKRQGGCDKVSDAKKKNCLERVELERALTTNQTTMCDKLKTKKDVCYQALAFKQKNPAVCASIVDTKMKVYCESRLNLSKAISAKNLDECSKLTDQAAKTPCLKSVIGAKNDPNICKNSVSVAATPESNILCQDLLAIRQALATKDREYCETIVSTALVQECLNNFDSGEITPVEVSVLDTDKDGLTNVDEKNKYKTNPNNPDTDGDGYSDGQEIKAGTNPLVFNKKPVVTPKTNTNTTTTTTVPTTGGVEPKATY